MMSKASWFFFMNSKPSPIWRVILGLKNPLAIPGRYFFDTSMTSYTGEKVSFHEKISHEFVYSWMIVTLSFVPFNFSL